MSSYDPFGYDGTSGIDGTLARLRTTIEQARSMPMSSSAVVSRGDVLDLIGQVESLVARLKAERAPGTGLNATYAEAQAAADRVLAEAHEERRRLIESNAVHIAAQSQADMMLRQAHEESEGLRRETDEYVDQKLANFEITLNKTLDAVARGRARLEGHTELEELGGDIDQFTIPEH
jgi:cell division septum initiation protein DivIVA